MPHAQTLAEAMVVLGALTTPEPAWGERLRARLDPFEDLVLPRPHARGGARSAIDGLRQRIETIDFAKAWLTGQKGSGKSFVLRQLARDLADSFDVLTVNLTDDSGNGWTDVDIRDLLLAIAARLVAHAHGLGASPRVLDDETGDSIARWARELVETFRLPAAPGRIDLADPATARWFDHLDASIRRDGDVRSFLREKVRSAELVLLVNALLSHASGPKPTLLLLDDGDKIDAAQARTLFGPNRHALASLRCSLVCTFPFSLNFDGVMNELDKRAVLSLANISTIHRNKPLDVLPPAVDWFRALLERLLVPGLIEEEALRRAVLLCGGVPSELGQVLQEACFQAMADPDARVITLADVKRAETELSLAMERATHYARNKERLAAVRARKELATEDDWRLLDANLLLEFVNEELSLWYDVHPLLQPVVDGWKA